MIIILTAVRKKTCDVMNSPILMTLSFCTMTLTEGLSVLLGYEVMEPSDDTWGVRTSYAIHVLS